MASWIFQGNPKKFRINDYLSSRKLIIWGIRQEYYAKKMSIGDKVFIWRSDEKDTPSGGIIAKGTIVSLPSNYADDAVEFWIIEPKIQPKLRVKIKLDEVKLNEKKGILKRSQLSQDKELINMKILSYFSQTNYLLDEKHAKRLDELWAEQHRE